MSTIKKLLALVLALTMVLSVSAFAGYTVAPYGDAAGIAEGAEEAVQLLYSLNIMKGDNKGNFNPEATITRAEVAKMVYVVLNYGEDDLAKNYTGAKFFSDIETGAWYEGYVNYAASIKLVQGRPDGTFGPNDPVTCAEAAKMLLTAIGYSAEARGYTGAGWDKQVLSDAAIIGLLEDYDYNTNTYAPRQWVAVMFKNALTGALTYKSIAPVVFNGLLTGINTNLYDYETMGQKYFGLYDWSGIIVANEYANLGANDKDALSAGRTQIDDVDAVFKNWTTDLTEIGEYREGWAIVDGSTHKVVYVTGHDDNTEWDNDGKEITDVTSKSKTGGIKQDGSTEYYIDFDKVSKADFYEYLEDTYTQENYVGNGDWLRFVHNDSGDSTAAEYVFLTTFEMTEVSKVAKDGTITLLIKDEKGNKIKSDEYILSEDVAAGDVVLYNEIDGNEYVTLVETFTGKVDKYTYKTRTLTVAGEEYPQSDIAYATIAADYFGDLEDAEKKTEYTYYLDFFGNIRIYSRSKADAGDLVLLTDAYFETNRKGAEAAVDAYIDGELTEVDVDYDEDYTDVKYFIEGAEHKNKWDQLTEYWHVDGAKTNIARTSIDEDGLMSLYFATTYNYNNKGDQTTIKAVYVTLDMPVKDTAFDRIDAGETTYDGEYKTYEWNKTTEKYDLVDTFSDVKVQATKNTVYYYVDSDLNIITVTGYKNSYDVIDEYVDVKAMYAVATNDSGESTDTDNDAAATDPDYKKYWVADVIVIETVDPVFNLDKNVVLGYNVVNKTVSDYADLEVIGADGAEDDLNVTNYNGYDDFEATEIDTPVFYFNTEDEDGDSHIREIESDFAKYGIYAETLNRVKKLDYVVTTPDGNGKTKIFNFTEDTTVYDMSTSENKKGKVTTSVTTLDEDKDPLALTTGKSYILYVDSDDVIVYAVLIEAYDDVASELFTAISGETVGALGKVKADAVEAAKEYAAATVASSWMQANYPTVEVKVADIQETLDAVVKAINDAKTAEAVAAVDYVAQLDAAVAFAKAAVEAADDAIVTIVSDKAVLVDGVAYTAPVEAEIGDELTLEFAADVIISVTGGTAAKTDLQNWTVTVVEKTVTITVAQ